MYSKSGVGYVLVETSATHQIQTNKKGVDGKPIVMDVVFNPVQYAYNYAQVCQLPIYMGRSPIGQRPCGTPGYGAIRTPADATEAASIDIYAIGGVYQYKYVEDIAPEVEIGDKIYFRPNTLNNAANCMGALKNQQGKPEKYIYKVPYENIICAVRDGRIIPIGGWVLLRPIFEDWDDILIPTYYDFTDKAGKKMQRPKKEWLQRKVAPTHEMQRAVVAHIGTPLIGDPCDIQVGETIVFKKQMKVYFQTIEGERYIVLAQEQILCAVDPEIKIEC